MKDRPIFDEEIVRTFTPEELERLEIARHQVTRDILTAIALLFFTFAAVYGSYLIVHHFLT